MLLKSNPIAVSLFAALTVLSACATPNTLVQEPVLPLARETQNLLLELPEPAQKLDVAVYKFEDVTGQFKPADGFQNLSRAVSQGGASILVKALQDAGNRSWFTVIERTNLGNLLQERKIITEMRQRYLGETKPNHKFLPPIRFAGILMEGGIVGYDSNTLTGGAGARLLGIGANAEYRQDTISVNLRAVSVKTGEIMVSTLVHKTLISAGISGASFSFVDFDKLLEIEAGVSTNEPGLVALTKAIEKAVHSLILEGVDLNLWAFKDPEAALSLVNTHRIESGRKPLSQQSPRQIAQQPNANTPNGNTETLPERDSLVSQKSKPVPKKAASKRNIDRVKTNQKAPVNPAPQRPTQPVNTNNAVYNPVSTQKRRLPAIQNSKPTPKQAADKQNVDRVQSGQKTLPKSAQKQTAKPVTVDNPTENPASIENRKLSTTQKSKPSSKKVMSNKYSTPPNSIQVVTKVSP